MAAAPNVAVKFAIKALADFTAGERIHLVGGAIRLCDPAGPASADMATSAPVANAAPCRLNGLVPAHSEALPGNQRAEGEMIPVRIHSNCSRWLDEPYRLCADVTGWDGQLEHVAASSWNIYLRGGRWYRQRFVAGSSAGVLEGAFFHFQRWKASYKQRRYGEPGMRQIHKNEFFLTPNGIFPGASPTDPLEASLLEAQQLAAPAPSRRR